MNRIALLAFAAVMLSGCHVCMDEVNAMAYLLPGFEFLATWMRTRWAVRHTAGCVHNDNEHQEN